MKNVRNLPLLLLCVAVLSGCLNSKNLHKEVTKKYPEIPEVKKKRTEGSIVVVSPLTTGNSQVATAESKTSKMLPLLLYWQWDYTNTCTLNPQIPVNNFTNTINSYASKGLQQKLGDRQLELSVDKIPHQFRILDKAHLIFLIYTFGWDNITIASTDMEMKVSYKVSGGSQEDKTGTITIPASSDKTGLGYFKSWRTATQEHLDQYDANITKMSKLVADKIVAEL